MFKTRTLLSKIGLLLGLASVLGMLITPLSAFAESSLPKIDTPPALPPLPTECTAILPFIGQAQMGQVTIIDSSVTARDYYKCMEMYQVQRQVWEQTSRDYWYRRSSQISQSFEFKIKLALLGGVLNAMGYAAQRVAYETAQLILTGGQGDEPMFWNQPIGDWMENVGEQAGGMFISELDKTIGDYTQKNFGARISFCSKPDPLSLSLSLSGVRPIEMMKPQCTLSAMANNFSAIADMVESGDALKIQKAQFNERANDLAVGITINNMKIQKELEAMKNKMAEREESRGMKPVMDAISWKLKYPSVMANDSMMKLNPVDIVYRNQQQQENYMMEAYWQAGLDGIAWITISTFANTMVVGILQRIFKQDTPTGDSINASPQKMNIQFTALQNADASGDAIDLYERQSFAKALGDYVVPNYASTEDRDIIGELSTCVTPRGKWNCAMDQALAVAINAGTKDGALTVGRAAGIGVENANFSPSALGMHADWELVPESDIKNNTDPSCAQRAYCAGNLKKLRLARIIPVGWEMAANSQYNVKKEGKYVLLGEVIRNFYNCNDKGQLDKDHPWCHLIDPNWILAAPKYQCRAKGYGDTVLPDSGNRLEECGDVVTCLGTNHKGECEKGFGYCLAERPVYKFEAKTCQPQFASCRTYSTKDGMVSYLRNSADRGHCSEENMGCTWYATQRYVTSTNTPDGLWLGSVTSGPRAYLDGNVKPCTAEGCTKMFRFDPGEPALNLVENGSFETVTRDDQSKITAIQGWDVPASCNKNKIVVSSGASEGALAIAPENVCPAFQILNVYPNRYYVLSYYVKSQAQTSPDTAKVSFYKQQQNISSKVTAYEDCSDSNGQLVFGKITSDGWQRRVCKFVSPDADSLKIEFSGAPGVLVYDAVQLEEGQNPNSFMDGLAKNLAESYLKIAPDEYRCTGNDDIDNPACKRFARVCSQMDVGCQGYRDTEDPAAPEIPARLTTNDLCPAICAGYGEYRKLASSFDLVKNADPQYNDPTDDTIAYFIPTLAAQCTLDEVGCEAFTSLEGATSTGEQVSYYNSLRSCEKPNQNTATYFTWEGSDANGYQLKTWSLIADSDKSPKILLKGAMLGSIKDPDTCNEITWKKGIDPDCRQFYDKDGVVYYRYYSQTISSDVSCALMRKSNSSETDCTKTGGQYVAETKDCMYLALPSESNSCSASSGGCRAYMGPTGRNAVAVLFEQFKDDLSLSGITFDKSKVKAQISKESVLVGDQSLKVESKTGVEDMDFRMAVPVSTTSTLYRVSFWAKVESSLKLNSDVSVDGQNVGSFQPDVNWKRFEFGPFVVKGKIQGATTTAEIAWHVPAGFKAIYLDTVKLDQLNDTQFVIKDKWSIPAACDATYPENIPEPHAMAGCRAYTDRDGNTAFVRKFSDLCREQAIGCKAFIDTRDNSSPYPKTTQVTGTPGPSKKGNDNSNNPADIRARMYDEQFLGDWNAAIGPYRYYYAIDDERAACDSGQAMCRGFGKPMLSQDGLGLGKPGFETVLLKYDFDSLKDEDGNLSLACRKDELFCNRFQSGNVVEYFRDPGNHVCTWRSGVALSKNEGQGIMHDGKYSGWFRRGTNIPCYPEYSSGGDQFMLQFTGEARYQGWGAECPQDQSECAEFVDPNDASDSTHPKGRSYFLINSTKLDTRSCGGVADPLGGCVLFNNKNVTELQASSKATYLKIQDEHGAPQSPIDCNKDPENKYCTGNGTCVNFVKQPNTQAEMGMGNAEYQHLLNLFDVQWNKFAGSSKAVSCTDDAECKLPMMDNQLLMGYAQGVCKLEKLVNDVNLVLKVKLDRECARWMGCRTGETVYDPTAQKFVNQCSQLELCEKNGSATEDIFCAKLTNRDNEDLLGVGKFITPETYSARPISFGSMDYSGYTIPNQYLLLDIKPETVGYDLLAGDKKDRYRYEKRLVAELPITSSDIAYVTDPNFKHPQDYTLCQDKRNGRIGYRLEGSDACLLSISGDDIPGQKTNLNKDVQQIYKEFDSGNGFGQNSLLQTSVPAPECQLYPEQDSPLPNQYVSKWNTNSQPPIPQTMMEGFFGSKACVYGEDCSCSYRKVRYQQDDARYYSLTGSAPSVGVCSGGKNAGASCVPGGYIPVDSKNRIMVSQGGATENICKDGICVPIQDVVVMNGKYAYCLERDSTRTNGVPQSVAPCLTWSPAAVMGGKYDLSHYSPTAGYLPPQGAGEYYCTSGANQQKMETWSAFTYDGPNCQVNNCYGEYFKSPGKLLEFGYSMADVWATYQSDGYQNRAIDGTSNISYGGDLDCMDNETCKSNQVKGQFTQNLRYQCRRATLCQGAWGDGWERYPSEENEKGGLDANPSEGRWIMTGDDINSSYLEYFIPSVKSMWGQNENFFDYHFGMFRFGLEPFPVGTACKWNPRWLGMSHQPIEDLSKTKNAQFYCQNYLQQVQAASQDFYSRFSASFPGILSRNNEAVLKDSQETPVKMKCTFGPWGQCYYKYWETGFQNSGQSEFKWPFMTHKDKLGNFSFAEQSNLYYAEECRSGKPYFGIRAVFQNVNDRMNAMSPDEARKVQLDGPWQFVGFWITTCLPSKERQDPGWLYMRMDVVTADVCREVGQVVAPSTRSNAAFADRVWSQGSFFLPVLGIRYTSRNEPFGSAIATGKIGPDPMLVGASTPLSDSSLKSPTFIDSGVTTAPLFAQQNAWVPLTNLFARVYKIYRWDPVPVFPGSYACVKGPSKGKACTWAANAYQGLKDCGDYSSCDPDVDKETINQNWRCNALSGVNRGLHCGDNNYPARNVDPICHNAALAWKWNEDTHQPDLTPLLSSCAAGIDASFTYPLDSFGAITLVENAGKLQTVWDYNDLNVGGSSDLGQGKEMTFKIIKCLGSDGKPSGRSFAYPSAPGQSKSEYSSGPNHYTDYGLGNKVLGIALGRIGQMATQIDTVRGVAKCNSSMPVEFTIPDELKKLPEFQDQKIQDALSKLAKNGSYPTWIALGPWFDDKIDQVRVNKCDIVSANAGERCGTPADSSVDCPLKVVACGSSEYSTLQKKYANLVQKKVCGCGYVKEDPSEPNPPLCVPKDCKANVEPLPCGQCVMNDENDNYKNLYPGTGYCKGFNPLSRCKTNNDCTFTDFEFWGAHDEGSATGKRWADVTSHLIITKDELGKVAVGPTIEIPTARLPLPLFNTYSSGFVTGRTTIVPKEFSDPAMLTNFTDDALKWSDIEQSGSPLDPGNQKKIVLFPEISAALTLGADKFPTSSLYPLCPNKAYLWNCVAGSGSGNNSTLMRIDYFRSCVENCRAAAFLIPNAYAYYFHLMPDRGPRTAAVAPFAVNPLIRTLNSLGTATPQAGGGTTYYGMTKSLMMGRVIQMIRDNVTSGEVPVSLVQGVDKLVIAAVNKFNEFTTSINTRADVLGTHKGGQGYLNATFPWNPNKLFFTTLFPLIIENQYSQMPLTSDFKGVSWWPWEQVWEGYGMSENLFTAFDQYISAQVESTKEPGNQDKKALMESKRKTFVKLAKTDMEKEFFSKTGWGAFIKPDDSRLKLFPFAVPAAVLAEPGALYPDGEVVNKVPDNKYTVYVPGHCEPPVGGTDTDSLKGKLESVVPVDNRFAHTGSPSFDFSFSPQNRFYRFQNAWAWLDQYQNGENLQDEGFKDPRSLVWVQPFLTHKPGAEPTNIPIDSDLWGDVKDLRTTCRCVGGRLEGTVQESLADCNKDLPESLNPDKMAKKDALYDPNSPIQDQAYCKQVSKDDGKPVSECQSKYGKPNDPDPDKDDNNCTHGPGYVPRGDVCADDKDQCLVTYNLTDPVSTNNKAISSTAVPAPSATDVTTGLDTYNYLTGGRLNKDGREYSSWYRPRPPRVAAPNTNITQSLAAIPVSAVDAFSLNGRPEGLEYFGGGQGLATLRLYAWAAHEQGPIKTVIIDWGDGTVQSIEDTQMKNQKPICNTDRECEYVPGLACSSNSDCPPGTGACLPMGNCTKQSYKVCHKDQDCGTGDTCISRVFFGNSSEACRQGYLEYQHVYKCDLNQSLSEVCDQGKRCEHEPNVKCTNDSQCRPNEKCVSGLAPSGGCLNKVLNRCRYTPRVLVMDNWGWCTGDCTQKGEAQPGGAKVPTSRLVRHPYGGCWDGSSTKINADVMLDPANAKTLINECMPVNAANLNDWMADYRPWVVYKGSIEVGYSGDKLMPDSNVNGSGSIYQMQQYNKTIIQTTP